MKAFWAITILIAMALSSVRASVPAVDWIELDNGDRIAGRILPTVDEDFVSFRHPVLGILKIPVGKFRRIQAPVVEVQAPAGPTGEVPPEGPAILAPDEVPVAMESLEKPAQQPEAPIRKPAADVSTFRLFRAFFPIAEILLIDQPLADWKHRASFGLRIHTGKHESQQFTGRLESNRNINGQSTLRSSLLREYAYYRDALNNRITTKDLFRGELRVRRQWSEDWFIQSLNRFRREPTRNVNYEITMTAGIGYQLLKTERLSMNVVPSVTGSSLDSSKVSASDGERVLASMFQDLAFRLNDRWSAAQSFEYNYDFDSEVGSSANLTLRVETRLLRSLSLSNRFELIYDARSPSTTEPYERRFLSELVYEF